ncbi:MAG: UPF0104 family protein [Chloroflexi bacterium]|nr:MAG: UPF0104 family protein [Chloroflexota bacterium]
MNLKRANIGRGLVTLAVAGFFAYRYTQSGGSIQLWLAVVLAAAGGLSLGGWAAPRWQNVAMNAAVTLFFLDFVFAEINLRAVGQALATANYWWLVPSTVFVLLHLYFRTLRWQWLLKPMGEVGFWPAFRGLVIGITGNAVLPARAGEFIRAYVLGRSAGLPKTGVFATLVVERIFDGLTVLLVLLGVVILGVRSEVLQTAGLLGAGFYVGALVAVGLFMTQRRRADALIHRLLPDRWAGLLTALLDSFTGGLGSLRRPRLLVMVTLWNILTWVMIPVSFYFALLAFDFGAPVPWQAPVLMLPAMALGLTIPAAPGGVGVVQAAVKLTLDISFADLPVAGNFAESVAAASILIHLSQFVPEMIPGFISFFIEGLTTSELSAGRQMAD